MTHQPPTSKDPKEPNIWIESLQTIGLSVVLALGIRQFVAEARYIPTGSMEPTLQVNDRLVVEKVSYYLTEPERGDIVVFWPPEEIIAEGQPRNAFIKRIIGLPGDTVEVIEGQVLINDQPIDERYIKAPPTYNWGPRTVPNESYIVFGDNRNNSVDSHEWPRPFLPEDQIIGKAVVRFWPPNRIGLLKRD
ncbi:MAG: signal peptidase I [Cyanobacteria bacterium P01_C01_bin.118]